MIRLRAEQHGLKIPVEAREFSLLQIVQTPGILLSGYRGSFPGGKAAVA